MDYEEYMKSILGYNQIPNNIYANTFDSYYDVDYNTSNKSNYIKAEILEPMYPEIYRTIYPMISKACNQNCNKEITNDLIDSLTEEIYLNVEPEDIQNQKPVLKNGDVRNPNAREPELRGESRQNRNQFLKDLIKILIIREFGRPSRPPRPMPPPRPPRPPYNQIPPWERY